MACCTKTTTIPSSTIYSAPNRDTLSASAIRTKPRHARNAPTKSAHRSGCDKRTWAIWYPVDIFFGRPPFGESPRRGGGSKTRVPSPDGMTVSNINHQECVTGQRAWFVQAVLWSS